MTKTATATALILDEAKKFAAKSLIVAIIGSLVFVLTPAWDRMKGIWHSPETLAHLVEVVHELQVAVSRASGEDRVIRMEPGRSYVEEPYYLGQDRPLRLNLYVQRTRLGVGCIFRGGTSLFTDESSVTLAGSEIPPSRNIGNVGERLVLHIDPPSELIAGRTMLRIDLTYTCNGVETFDRTDPVFFYATEQDQ